MTALDKRREEIVETLRTCLHGDKTRLTLLATAQGIALYLITIACAYRREPLPGKEELVARTFVIMDLLGLPLEVPDA